MILHILLIWCYFGGIKGNPNSITVEVEEGILEGKMMELSTGKGKCIGFEGVPYATPPLGDLRFKAPQPLPKWEGVRKATKHGPVCIQPQTLESNLIIGSEDCLYLNIYTSDTDPSKPKAVMLFIHGGYFLVGSGNSNFYSPDFLINHDVVVVTINYRLGLFGFLSVDTKDVPGNAGLKDQVFAMRWVKRNIRKFGGDPDNVTIFGHSSGASSVTFHLVSEEAAGLFKRAIAMSGTLYNDFSKDFKHKERAFVLGRRLGYYASNEIDLIKYLRSVPAEKLASQHYSIRQSEEALNSLNKLVYFVPIIEKKVGGFQLITEQPKTIVSDVDIMIGHAESEGLRNTISVQQRILKLIPKYKELYVPLDIYNIRNKRKVYQLGEKIEYQYFGNSTVTLTNISSYTQLYSYSNYVYHIQYFVDNVVPRIRFGKTYFYKFSKCCKRNPFSAEAPSRYGFQNATHGDILPYIFAGKGYNLTLEKKSKAYEDIETVVKLFTNFAKHGNPLSQKVGDLEEWPVYDDHRKVLNIDRKLSVETVQYTGDLGFWNDIYAYAKVKPYVGR